MVFRKSGFGGRLQEVAAQRGSTVFDINPAILCNILLNNLSTDIQK